MIHIIAYDAADGRCESFRKLLSQYLHSVQNSVFEGELSHAMAKQLQSKLDDIMQQGDKVVVYRYRKGAVEKTCHSRQEEIHNVI